MKKINLCGGILVVLMAGLLAGCAPEEIAPERDMPARVPAYVQADPSIPYTYEDVPIADIWPSGPVTAVVPFLAGGDTDMYARMLAPFLTEILGQPVNVINEDGGGINLTAIRVSRAEPDGYTVLFYHTGDLFVNHLSGISSLTHEDFEIACVAIHCDANIMVIRAGLGINNAREFLSYIRENPMGLSSAVVESSFAHALLNIAESAGGFDLEVVNIGSARLKAASVLVGHADTTYNNLALFLPYIETGELIPLWIASSERNHRLPDVPTLAEIGLRDAYIGRSYFFAFPRGTDSAIASKLSDAVRQATETEEFRQQLFDAVSLFPSFVPYYEIAVYMEERWYFYTSLEAYIVS